MDVEVSLEQILFMQQQQHQSLQQQQQQLPLPWVNISHQPTAFQSIHPPAIGKVSVNLLVVPGDYHI